MTNLRIESKVSFTPGDFNDPRVLLKKVIKNIETTGSVFSRITMYAFDGSFFPNLAKNLLSVGDDIGTKGYIFIEHLSGSKVGIGTDPEISCNITDGGGGTLNLYSVGHGLFAGYSLIINGSTYSGNYVVDSYVDVDNFKIVEVYSIDESTVPVYSKDLCEAQLEENDYTFFRLNDALTNLYVICENSSAVIEVIIIED